VFRIVRIGFVLVCLVGLVWVGTQVKLGELTLSEHVRAISDSRESKDLIEGTKTRVSEVGRLIGDSPKAAAPKPPSHEVVAGGDKPAETVSDTDRKALKKMLESRK